MSKQIFKTKKRKDILNSALKYAEVKLPVFPVHSIKKGECTCGDPNCKSPGKHPHYDSNLMPNGFKGASIDPGQIKKWWGKWPNANIGLWTTNFFAIDVDLPGGPANLIKIEEKYGKLPETITNRTGSGGYQLLFKQPEHKIKNSASTIAENIDIRGETGYIIVPPSVHKSGDRYKWEGENFPRKKFIASAPQWLIDLINEGEKYCDFVHLKKEIPIGKRNNELTSIGGYFRQKGYNYEEILEELKKVNEIRCKPPLEEAEIEKIAKSTSNYTPGTNNSKADKIHEFTEFILESIETFHNSMMEYYVCVLIREHREVYRINSKNFRNYCRNQYRSQNKTNLKKNDLEEIILSIEANAEEKNRLGEVYIRQAAHNNKIYLDLANDSGDIVEITENGWSLCSAPPVYFFHPPGMEPLPIPIDKKRGIDKLKKYLPEKGKTLIVSWLIGSLNVSGPYPILVLKGSKGSSKSTTTEILKRLIDPAKAIRKTLPKNEHDLMIAAKGNWIITYDNLSYINEWLSNALCRLSTGGGLSARKHYTDDEEIIFEAKRPIIFNGIPNLIERPDLADRTIIIELPEIAEENRKQECLIWKEFENDRPFILGSVLTAVSEALKNHKGKPVEGLPRMADFAHWVISAEQALPWKKGGFLKTYQNHLNGNLEKIYLGDTLTYAIKTLCEHESWEGTATQLLKELQIIVGPEIAKALPRGPMRLFPEISARSAAFNHLKINIEKRRTGEARTIIISKK